MNLDSIYPLIPLCSWGDDALDNLENCFQFKELLTLKSGCKTFNFDDDYETANRYILYANF